LTPTELSFLFLPIFGLSETEATRKAGAIAGLDVVGIVTEPVGAALSVGIRGDETKCLFIYDLGGGTFAGRHFHSAFSRTPSLTAARTEYRLREYASVNHWVASDRPPYEGR
jgi:hypothetical protein